MTVGKMMNPIILGILNITTDSFSDGGRYLSADAALAHGRALMAGGAQGLDLGAAASNVNADKVSPDDEIARLAPVVAALKGEGVPLSIDTFAPPVQRWAIDQGVGYLNDIHGFPDPALYPALKDSAAKLIVMHAVQDEGIATTVDIPPETIFSRIVGFFGRRLEALTRAGIAASRLIIDPGMGMFLGRDPAVSYEVLARLPELKSSFGLPLLISLSRKSFLRQTAQRSIAKAGPATLAAELFAVVHGADYIRTHDPAALAAGVAVWSAAACRNRTSS